MTTHTLNRWRLAAPLAAALLVGSVLVPAGAANGKPTGPLGDGTPWASARLDTSALAAAGLGSRTVTLITGTGYDVETDPTGKVTVTPTQARRTTPNARVRRSRRRTARVRRASPRN